MQIVRIVVIGLLLAGSAADAGQREKRYKDGFILRVAQCVGLAVLYASAAHSSIGSDASVVFSDNGSYRPCYAITGRYYHGGNFTVTDDICGEPPLNLDYLAGFVDSRHWVDLPSTVTVTTKKCPISTPLSGNNPINGECLRLQELNADNIVSVIDKS